MLVSAACSSSSSDNAAVEPVTDEPQYGDSLDEFLEATDASTPVDSIAPEGFTEIEWESLIPPGSSGDEIYARFSEEIAAYEPGSPEIDEIYAKFQEEYENQPPNADLAGQNILLVGFIAPLTYEGELITEFLLVPYFGACIHVPPPPPNQTIMVTLADGAEGLTIDDSWGTVWVTGTLTIDGADTDLAEASYSISGAQAGVHSGT